MDQLAFNADVIAKFREGGEIEGLHRDRLLLLTTLGRRTAEPRTAPMMFHLDEDPIVMASNDGSPGNPSWFVNLESEPRVTVELPDETYETTAQLVEGAEYERLWAEISTLYPFFIDHQRRAGSRRIPLVRLPRD